MRTTMFFALVIISASLLFGGVLFALSKLATSTMDDCEAIGGVAVKGARGWVCVKELK